MNDLKYNFLILFLLPLPVHNMALKCIHFDYYIYQKMLFLGNSLEVQWFGLCVSTTGGTGSIPGLELRSRMLQRVRPKNQKIKIKKMLFLVMFS